MTKVLALIPARGGSKGLPGKNVRQFFGKPLIYWSIKAAQESCFINRVIVSTDDPDIASIARSFGAEVPFLRPSELARESTVDYPVFKHALDFLLDTEDYMADLVVQLRPTTPVRTMGMVDKGIKMILGTPDADSLRCVTIPTQTPYKMWTINNDGYLDVLIDSGVSEQYNMPRQLLPEAYWQVGSLDIIKTNTIIFKKSMTGDLIIPLYIDNRYAVDIDDEQSLMHACAVVDKYGIFPYEDEA